MACTGKWPVQGGSTPLNDRRPLDETDEGRQLSAHLPAHTDEDFPNAALIRQTAQYTHSRPSTTLITRRHSISTLFSILKYH